VSSVESANRAGALNADSVNPQFADRVHGLNLSIPVSGVESLWTAAPTSSEAAASSEQRWQQSIAHASFAPSARIGDETGKSLWSSNGELPSASSTSAVNVSNTEFDMDALVGQSASRPGIPSALYRFSAP
jgi:hypothetical protein